MKTISLIIPVYNAEKYLAQCIESIINQTYSNIQVILVDDGSSDHSASICDNYAQRDHRITVIHKKNGGAPSARNAALEIANGEYVMFVDSDDYLELNACEVCEKHMTDNNLDVFMFDKYIHENGKVKKISEMREAFITRDRKIISEIELAVVYNKFSPYGYCYGPIFIWDKIYRNSIIQERKIKFPEKVYGQDDISFNSVYFGFAHSMQYAQIPLYNYRVIEASLSHKYTANRVDWDDALTYALQKNPDIDGITLSSQYEQAVFCRVLQNYYVCAHRCFFHKDNPKSLYKKIRYANKISKQEPYLTALRNVDAKFLSKKLRLLKLCRFNRGLALYCITRLGIVKRYLSSK